MNAATLKTLREAIGLSQSEFAEIVGVSQAVVSAWEAGKREPRNPISVMLVLRNLADVFVEVIDETTENLENASDKLGSPAVHVRVYNTNEEYWAADARARTDKIPASLHRAAVGIAVILAEAELGVTVDITDH